MSESKQTDLDVPRGGRWHGPFTFLSPGSLKLNESAAVLGFIACLILFSLALASDD